MYPAAGVGSGLITPDDLPDQIEVGFFSLFEGTRIFDKVGGEYTCDFPNGEARVFVDNDFTIEFIWRFQYLADGQDGILNANRPQCLFQEQESINEEGARDLFADTYTLTSIYGSVAVSRVSLCRWESPPVEVGSLDLGGTLEYYPINPMEGQPSPAWLAAMDDGQAMSPAGGEKTSPNLSSPVGTYTDLFLPNITVS